VAGSPTGDDAAHDDVPEPDDAGDDAATRAAAVLREAEEAAAAKGRAMVDEARAVRKRMLDDLERRRATLLAELERVRAAVDDLAHDLAAPLPHPERAEGSDVDVSSTPPEPPENGTEPGDVFAQLRADQAAPAPAPARRPKAPTPPVADAEAATSADIADAPSRPEPPPLSEPSAAPTSPDDVIRRRRDEVLAPLTDALVRSSKRLLQDEHNDLLDAVRRSRGRVDASRLLPDPERQHHAWSVVLAPTIDEAYAVGRALTGRGRRPASAPRRLVAELAAGLITPLRDRLTVSIDTVIADGPYEGPGELQGAVGPVISARYREWRARDLESHLGDLLAAAYARGVFDATPSGATLRWVPAEVGQCPDADDNALEPTIKGHDFPTGQACPPAHPGCRCLVVPTDVGGSEPSV
jgi:hypothetical protein